MSYRSDNGASYDRTLLSSVPDPTRAEKQEGYNVDLLDEGSAPSPPKAVPPATSEGHAAPTSAVGYSPGAVSYARKEEAVANGHEPVVAKVPWYRKKWGIALIVVVVLLVIGGAVGGAVGGTQHSSHPKTNNTGSTVGQGENQNTNSQQQVGGSPSAPSPSSSPAGGGGTQLSSK
ncbi:hypothetical protein BC827DRAFT_1159165 [Russula dissimulans]|nr:hypothetical protein BC827DRAFT_1159165 [Russula dissimulans]